MKPILMIPLVFMLACGDGKNSGSNDREAAQNDRETAQNDRETAQSDRESIREVPGTLRLYPGNRKYLEYKGKPVILITSAEHYGAVVNMDFDEIAYLEALADEGFNYTRIFTGTYIEPVDNVFGIEMNTLAPLPGRYLSPWMQEDGKYDLDRFNPGYFERLRNFVSHAGEKGIIVEVTLFSSIYDEGAWRILPFHAGNNVNGVGEFGYRRVHTLFNGELLAFQEKFIRKVVRELNAYDNIFYEIQNEPWADHPNLVDYVNLEEDTIFTRSWQQRVEVADDVSADWQAWVVKVISDEESGLDKKHLIAQNISNFQHEIRDPLSGISIFNFHYAQPDAVRLNAGLQGVTGLDETGFMPRSDLLYITQAWRFILSGGGLYNNLDYSFTAGHEGGDWPIPGSNPGWGGKDFRKKLSFLVRAMEKVPFHRMEHSDSLFASGSPELLQYGLHSDKGSAIVYLENCRGTEFYPRVQPGNYRVTWLNIHSGVRIGSREFLNTETFLVSPFPLDRVVVLIEPVH
ncbi:MAG: hypothetical protein R6U78_10310 [Bacteroidales bacterium]